MQEGVARIEPAKRRQDRQCVAAQLSAGRRKKVAHWNDSIGADESVDLDPERDERDQKNQTDRAQEPSPRNKISRRANVIAPEHSRDRRRDLAVKRNNFVKAFRSRRETRNVIITPRQPFF